MTKEELIKSINDKELTSYKATETKEKYFETLLSNGDEIFNEIKTKRDSLPLKFDLTFNELDALITPRLFSYDSNSISIEVYDEIFVFNTPYELSSISLKLIVEIILSKISDISEDFLVNLFSSSELDELNSLNNVEKKKLKMETILVEKGSLRKELPFIEINKRIDEDMFLEVNELNSKTSRFYVDKDELSRLVDRYAALILTREHFVATDFFHVEFSEADGDVFLKVKGHDYCVFVGTINEIETIPYHDLTVLSYILVNKLRKSLISSTLDCIGYEYDCTRREAREILDEELEDFSDDEDIETEVKLYEQSVYSIFED